MKMLVKKKQGHLFLRFSPARATLAVAASALHLPYRSGKNWRGQIRPLWNPLCRFVMYLLYHIPAQKVAEKGKENGDDTHPQTRKDLVIQL